MVNCCLFIIVVVLGVGCISGCGAVRESYGNLFLFLFHLVHELSIPAAKKRHVCCNIVDFRLKATVLGLQRGKGSLQVADFSEKLLLLSILRIVGQSELLVIVTQSEGIFLRFF